MFTIAVEFMTFQEITLELLLIGHLTVRQVIDKRIEFENKILEHYKN